MKRGWRCIYEEFQAKKSFRSCPYRHTLSLCKGNTASSVFLQSGIIFIVGFFFVVGLPQDNTSGDITPCGCDSDNSLSHATLDIKRSYCMETYSVTLVLPAVEVQLLVWREIFNNGGSV